jgi:hypothetical protein
MPKIVVKKRILFGLMGWIVLIMMNEAIAEPNYYFADSNCRFVDLKKKPHDLKREIHGVLKEREENILVGGCDDDLVAEVVVATCETYEKVSLELIEIAKKHFGVKSVEDFVERDYWKEQVRFSERIDGRDLAERERKGFAKLEQIGLSTKEFQWRRIRTEKFNVVDKIHGYSELGIEIIDGNSVFGRPCTLISLSRTDHWKDWARHHEVPIYLPIKGPAEDYVITETEVELLEEFCVRMGYKEKMKVFPIYPMRVFPLDDPSLVFKLKEVIDQCDNPVKNDDPCNVTNVTTTKSTTAPK